MSKNSGHELRTIGGGELTKREQADQNDDDQLARVGKKAVLKRNFGFMSILGFSCTILVTWEGTLVLFLEAIANGGPAGAIYSFLLVWLGNISVFTTLSELASMAPTSGGQYHWVSMLAPRSCAKFLSYVTGWLTAGGWLGSLASIGYLTAGLIQGLIFVVSPTYDPQPYQALLLMWAVLLFAVLINTVLSRLLPKFEGLILVVHVLGFFAILIAMVTLGPRADAKAIFTTFVNLGHWPTQGVSFLIGTIANAVAFVGADAAFHMSEEVHNPSLTVPRSIFFSMLINGSAGFAMTLVMLFCSGDLDKVLESKIPFPFMEIFFRVTNSHSASSFMSSLVIILGGCAAVGVLASTSRVIWSFARDRGLPGWRTLSKVDDRSSVPLYSVAFTTTCAGLLGLITLGSSTAFNDIISLTISCLYASYLLTSSLLLYRRCTGGFALPSSCSHPALANTTGAELVWGPWHLPGIWGILNNAFTIIYVIVVGFFSIWPKVLPVTPASMNYSIVVTSFVAIVSVVYYLVWAKKVYNGPIIET